MKLCQNHTQESMVNFVLLMDICRTIVAVQFPNFPEIVELIERFPFFFGKYMKTTNFNKYMKTPNNRDVEMAKTIQ